MWELSLPAANHGQRVIFRLAIDDKNFVAIGRVFLEQQRLQRRAEEPLLVANRHNNGDKRLHNRSRRAALWHGDFLVQSQRQHSPQRGQ